MFGKCPPSSPQRLVSQNVILASSDSSIWPHTFNAMWFLDGYKMEPIRNWTKDRLLKQLMRRIMTNDDNTDKALDENRHHDNLSRRTSGCVDDPHTDCYHYAVPYRVKCNMAHVVEKCCGFCYDKMTAVTDMTMWWGITGMHNLKQNMAWRLKGWLTHNYF